MAKILKSNIPFKGPSTENVIEFIKDGLHRNPRERIIVDSVSGRYWTGREIEAAVIAIANFLLDECDLKKGDVCSIYSPENDHVAIVILAIIAAGGTSQFLTDKSVGRDIHDTAIVLKTKVLISTSQLLDKIQPDLEDLDANLKVVSFDGNSNGWKNGCRNIENFLSKEFLDLKLSLDELVKRIHIDDDSDFAIIQFSSGTTGKPKPIPRTHKNLCHLVASVSHEELMDLKPGVVLSGSLPITHRPGIWALLACIHGGSAFVIFSKMSDVDAALDTISRHKVTIFSSSLPFLSMLGNLGPTLKAKYDLSSWQHVITSGAKIVNPELPRAIVREFELKSLRQCFGMTECGWVFIIEMSQAEEKYLTVGHVVPGMEAMIMHRDNEATLGAHERGEVALRGPQIFPGYLTGEINVFNRSDFTESGWFKTGDQGYYDEDELVFIEGRYKEVMMFENNCLYFPNEIEAIINEHPAIESSCVVKVREVRDEYLYDVARACVTLKQGFSITEKDLLDHVREKQPSMIIGDGIRILDKFPRLQNGKVDKQALKQ